MSDMSQVHHMLGKLIAGQDEAVRVSEKTNQTVEAVHRRLDDINKEVARNAGALILATERHDSLKTKIDTVIEPQIEDYKKNKQRGLGMVAALGLGGGGIGAWAATWLAKIFSAGN
jgi:tRNA U34 5-carboxymethylaminomethyl modifying GTPase MnmE/TrmE